MALFRRGKAGKADVDSTPADPTSEATADDAATEDGPYDRAQVTELGERLDLGSLWVPGITGMELRLELDQQTGEVVAVSCHLGGSALQLQAFAAPRTLGIWDNIRDEIAAGIEGQGGAAETRDGRFGTELAVQMPTGPGTFAPARFLGVDGSRWFLRGFLSGPAAEDDQQAADLLHVFANVVVVRGEHAMAPRELLPLALPEGAQPGFDEVGQDGVDAGVGPGDGDPAADRGDRPARGTDDLQPFERGPEITEIR